MSTTSQSSNLLVMPPLNENRHSLKVHASSKLCEPPGWPKPNPSLLSYAVAVKNHRQGNTGNCVSSAAGDAHARRGAHTVRARCRRDRGGIRVAYAAWFQRRTRPPEGRGLGFVRLGHELQCMNSYPQSDTVVRFRRALSRRGDSSSGPGPCRSGQSDQPHRTPVNRQAPASHLARSNTASRLRHAFPTASGS